MPTINHLDQFSDEVVQEQSTSVLVVVNEDNIPSSQLNPASTGVRCVLTEPPGGMVEVVPPLLRHSSSVTTVADYGKLSPQDDSALLEHPPNNAEVCSQVLSEIPTQKTSQCGFVWDTEMQTQESFQLGTGEELSGRRGRGQSGIGVLDKYPSVVPDSYCDTSHPLLERSINSRKQGIDGLFQVTDRNVNAMSSVSINRFNTLCSMVLASLLTAC